MGELAIRNTSIDGLNRKIPYNMSGKEIMDYNVAIANELDKLFKPEMLYEKDFLVDMGYSDDSYKGLVKRAIENAGYESDFIENPRFEPAFGYMHKYYGDDVSKRELKKTLEKMNVLEQELFEETPEDELMAVHFYINAPWNTLSGYFIEDWVADGLKERGVPDFLISFFASLYIAKEKFAGKRDEKSTAREIEDLLNNRINPSDTKVVDSCDASCDLFEYRQRLFLARPSDPKLDYLGTKHQVGFLNLYYAYAIYAQRIEGNKIIFQKPIGYKILKSEGNKKIENPKNAVSRISSNT